MRPPGWAVFTGEVTVRPGLALLTLLLAAMLAPAAQSAPPAERQAAQAALERAKALRSGEGVRNGRELTPALAELATRLDDLGGPARREAELLLARPDLLDGDGDGDGYEVPEETPWCSTNFCVHYVDSTLDAPSPTDANANGVPDYVESVAAWLEASYQRQVADLGWVAPRSDGPLGGGGDGKTDAYLRELNPENVYGYAATDVFQLGPNPERSRHGYLVLDDDYAFGGGFTPTELLQTTAAHELNHLLQFTYDTAQAAWMLESTATWMEDETFDDVDEYVGWIPTWNGRTEDPLTKFERNKIYGSAVWNHWLSARYGLVAVRDAWAFSASEEPHFGPGAYDAAIADRGGGSFEEEFGRFAAATAEWRAPLPAARAFPEGSQYGTVERIGPSLSAGTSTTRVLDHTTFTLIDVPVPAAGDTIHLNAATASGAPAAIALVAREGSESGGVVTTEIEHLPQGGEGSVSLPSPSGYERITAVLVNPDTAHSGSAFGYDGDFVWSGDDLQIGVTLSTDPGAAPPDAEPPDTIISAAPSAVTTDRSATFSFASPETVESYWCALDAGSFVPCGSPRTYTNLAAGQHTFRVAARDHAGNQDRTPATYTWTITGSGSGTTASGGSLPSYPAVPYLPPGTGSSATDSTPPLLEGLRFGSARFRPARGLGASVAAARGSVVEYSLSEQARVRFRVAKLERGRRVGAKCVRRTKRNRKRRGCTRTIRLHGSFEHDGSAGANSFRFTGRLGNAPLSPGRYKLTGIAQDRGGNVAPPAAARFRIVRR